MGLRLNNKRQNSLLEEPSQDKEPDFPVIGFDEFREPLNVTILYVCWRVLASEGEQIFN